MKTLKSSRNMLKSIERLEKKYGTLRKDFGVESVEAFRVGRGFYDYCELTCDILKSLKFTVSHDGSIHNC